MVWMLMWAAGCGGRASCPEGTAYQYDQDDCATLDEDAEPAVPDEPVWQPAPGVSWQWQLTGALDTSLDVEMFDLDPFRGGDPGAQIAGLQADGVVVICYFSAGSMEDWRDDAGDFPDEAIGSGLRGWDGEYWIDIQHPGVRSVMAARLDQMAAWGCDGVEPDNVDGYANRNGVGLNATEQLEYNRWLADQAHARGLSVGLKNDLDQLEELVDWFDWALNEECASYSECGRLSVFTDAQKAAFHVEYVDDWSDAEDKAAEVCGAGPALDTLIKTWDLGAEHRACGG